ncbi:type VII secretion-associated serine protease mycosin [Micromonospora sp. HNM0581]|uniref:type VII secretion-associated serine protease mycosin n=1 Tax=Micromonospora sp. HNM0581 TaxID=2716341 RepID=UPI00146C0CD6|nr:type VII secretion-associated serine protease mycosin [Micromonospora sp. HNM0581]NLU80233.1 type VII secretion-associated serine protease mycosin [Micromonospora sp. HNM0581]
MYREPGGRRQRRGGRRRPGALRAGLCVVLLACSVPAVAVPAHAAPRCAALPAPAEPTAPSPWAQQRYATERLARLATGAGVTVAVVDSGVDRRHPQLAGRVLTGTDLLDAGGDGGLDCVGHGTGVASIIAAAPGDGTALQGLAPQARVLPVRVSEQQVVDGHGQGRTATPDELGRAVRWAVDEGATVLNLSVVLYTDHHAVRAAIAYALRRDVVVVAAAGNMSGNEERRPYPAAYDGVLGVGAVGPDGVRADFSRIGAHVDLVAPGVDVLIAAPGHGHRGADGTSYAAPFVAATAALIRQYRPDLDAVEVARRIVTTADPATGVGYGAGVLNPYRAVTESVALSERPRPTTGLADDRPDPALLAQQDRRADARARALLVTGVGVPMVAAVVLAAVMVPRGVRRRWHPADHDAG